MKIETFSEKETFELGKKLGTEAKPGQIYALLGDLGVGKTILTKGFAEGLGITEPVSQSYIYHRTGVRRRQNAILSF